ncbi:MAG: hypothetical protein HY537_16105, partial [Deltaproteobacteria bacterium]|nr:hypothetical protein [Deltaproteobacteria bacterium]
AYASEQKAVEQIRLRLANEYLALDRAKLDQSINEVITIFKQNIFPEMKTDWRTHPDNRSHLNWPGCFRCHDGKHVDSNGKAISNNCNGCHNILSQGYGIAAGGELQKHVFKHPGGELSEVTTCHSCHGPYSSNAN